MRNTFQKKVDKSRNNNDSKGSHKIGVISTFYFFYRMELKPVKNSGITIGPFFYFNI